MLSVTSSEIAACGTCRTRFEFHSNVKGHVQSAIHDISDEVVYVGILHPNERAMYGNSALELGADRRVQCEACFPCR